MKFTKGFKKKSYNAALQIVLKREVLNMKCAICKNGTTEPGVITIVLEKNKSTLVFKDVPAEICKNCGEEYVSSETNTNLLKKANDAVTRGVDLEMLKYAA
jgi:YgiT-type zinc finger domain-containing protein